MYFICKTSQWKNKFNKKNNLLVRFPFRPVSVRNEFYFGSFYWNFLTTIIYKNLNDYHWQKS